MSVTRDGVFRRVLRGVIIIAKRQAYTTLFFNTIPFTAHTQTKLIFHFQFPSRGARRGGRVVTTVRRLVCSREKSSKPRAKEAALAAHARAALPLLNSELERELRQFPLKTAC